jgi:hypothetical protein
LAWSNPQLIALAERFVPCADEVWRLQNGKDFECELFRRFSERGHYRDHGSTRQGVYVATPSGELLGSVNSRDVEVLARLLRDALARWEELTPAERSLEPAERDALQALWRWDDERPDDGLVLEVLVRDLPRPAAARAAFDADQRRLPRWARWTDEAWNRDWAWFRAEEARSWLPDGEPEVGAEYAVPAPLVERLVRLHLLDFVRGQTIPYRREDLERAELLARVEAVDGTQVRLALRGGTRCAVEDGEWPRSFESDWQGTATWDRDAARFTAFELVAVGTRSGRTQFNGRQQDPGPSPVGVVLRLAADDAPRVAPAFVGSYGWQQPARRR